MAKYELRIKAREMRSKGESVKDIAKTLRVAKSTASLWVRDIILSVNQLEKLRKKEIKGAELGRLRSALKQKERRKSLIEYNNKLGLKNIGKLTKRELLISGLAIYWGEGSKKSREVELCNSDPNLIKFMLNWFINVINIKPEEIKCWVGINEIHRERDKIVRQYWSKITGIPLNQFRKTSFKKVTNKKIYANFNEHYGTLALSVIKPARYYYKILGLIEALSTAGRGLVSQGVS